MKARLSKLFTWCMFFCLTLPGYALAAGGGKVANVVIVADTRKFTGWEAWWTNLYNESHLYFAILTMALIPTIGVLFGLVADFFMSMIGIDLKSRELAEH
jgi:cytochrome b561